MLSSTKERKRVGMRKKERKRMASFEAVGAGDKSHGTVEKGGRRHHGPASICL